MKSKQEILKALEAAIDSGDMPGVYLGLEALASAEQETIMPEDTDLFSARILKLSEEKHHMKHFSKTARVAVAVAAVLLMGVTVYAAVTMKLFSFYSGDKLVTIRSTENMTQQEAQAMADETQAARVSEEEGVNVIYGEDLPTQRFASLAEAEAGMDMVIPLPAAMPDLAFSEATGQTLPHGEGNESRTVWITYGDIESGRMFGVTVIREVIVSGEATTHIAQQDIDKGSFGNYTSKTGVKYNTFAESDDTGARTAHIAQTMIGEYDYALLFYGFDEAERQAIIDSTDLSAYGA